MFLLPVTVGRSGIWLVVELFVLLMVTAAACAKETRWNRSPPFRRGPRSMFKTLAQSVLDEIEKKRLQQKILDHVHRNTKPIFDPPTPRPKDLPTKHGKDSIKVWFSNTPQNEDNFSFMLAEASEPYRPDTVKFRISSNVFSHIANVENAVLSLRLKLNKRNRRAERRCKKERKRKMLEMTALAAAKNKAMKSEDPATQKGGNATVRIPPACGKKSNRKGLKKKRGKRFRKRLKPRRVRLVVRLFDVKAKKKRRIFAREVEVKKTNTVGIQISPEMLRNAIESSNHTVSVQILCRKCRRRVLIDKVFKSPRKHRKRTRRLNPHRPYLIITKSDTARKSDPHATVSRSKRQVPNNVCDFRHYNSPENETTPMSLSPHDDNECCSDKRYITFNELGFSDWIVYPLGFSTAICLGSCGNEPSQPVLSNQNEVVPMDAKKKTTVPALHDNRCRPLDSSHLDIIYFSNSNTLVSGHLPHLIATSCGCAW